MKYYNYMNKINLFICTYTKIRTNYTTNLYNKFDYQREI